MIFPSVMFIKKSCQWSIIHREQNSNFVGISQKKKKVNTIDKDV